MELKPGPPTAKAPVVNFTGDGYVNPSCRGVDPSRMIVSLVRFTPGAAPMPCTSPTGRASSSPATAPSSVRAPATPATPTRRRTLARRHRQQLHVPPGHARRHGRRRRHHLAGTRHRRPVQDRQRTVGRLRTAKLPTFACTAAPGDSPARRKLASTPKRTNLGNYVISGLGRLCAQRPAAICHLRLGNCRPPATLTGTERSGQNSYQLLSPDGCATVAVGQQSRPASSSGGGDGDHRTGMLVWPVPVADRTVSVTAVMICLHLQGLARQRKRGRVENHLKPLGRRCRSWSIASSTGGSPYARRHAVPDQPIRRAASRSG